MWQAANPFGNIPHALDFFRSASHAKVLQRITSGLKSHSGLLLLTGEIGSGKTTLCKFIEHQFQDNVLFSNIANPFLTKEELLRQLCSDMGATIQVRGTVKHHVDALEEALAQHYATDKTCVLFLDESHLLTKAHFQLLLVLSNLKRDNVPLLQIVMIGQYELISLLEQPGLEAMNQRIGTRTRLEPLSSRDTAAYVDYKLERAQFIHKDIFDHKSLKRIHRLTGGLPRLINHVCAHAMDQAAIGGKARVTLDMIDHVFSDPMYTPLLSARTAPQLPWKAALAGALVCLLLVLGTAGLWGTLSRGDPTVDPAGLQMDIATSSVRLSADPRPPHLPPTSDAQGKEQTIPSKASSEPPPSESRSVRTTAETKKSANKEGKDNAPAEATIQAQQSGVVKKRQEDRSEAPSDDKPDKNTDLPDAALLPAFKGIALNAVSWASSPPNRLVILDDAILHEGDDVRGGTLLSIEKDHVVLGYDRKKYVLYKQNTAR